MIADSVMLTWCRDLSGQSITSIDGFFYGEPGGSFNGLSGLQTLWVRASNSQVMCLLLECACHRVQPIIGCRPASNSREITVLMMLYNGRMGCHCDVYCMIRLLYSNLLTVIPNTAFSGLTSSNLTTLYEIQSVELVHMSILRITYTVV